ncbi:uncharacterized protein [Euwallacea similis]|uniref:uncharacterized protein n=1 Tax=Euwallacea similis TaxID=1736056 RepID=UPI0034501272
MKLVAFSFVIAFAIVSVQSHPVGEYDSDEDVMHLVPLRREKRQQKTDFHLKSPGIATLSHQGTILNNNNHRLDGMGYATKDFSRHGGLRPDTYGGSLDYLHKPSGAGLGVSADHFRGSGTSVGASGTWNFIQRPNANFGITGQYQRHFGPGGGKPDYGIFLGGKANF